MDFDAAGLLDGLEGDERQAREHLLRWLSEQGAELDELRAAVAEDRLALLPVERVLGGSYTAAEIEERTGVPAEALLRLRRMLGLPEASPDDRVFAEEQIEAAEAMKTFDEVGFDEQTILEITRVLGEGMARLAATTTAAFAQALLEQGDSEQDVAMRFASAAERLKPGQGPVLVAAYDAHLREAVRRGIISRDERQAGKVATAQETTVAFADLVGFTRLGGELDVHELGGVAGKLAELSSEVTRPPVRLVKTIGDAAMFVSPDAGPMVDVALSLCEAVEEAELPALRVGLAHGSAAMQAGDFYGHAVNLASRVTGIARPASVLCTQEVHDAAPEEFRWSFAGRHRLKGIGEAVRLHRARRLSEARESSAAPHQGERSERGQRESTKQRAGRPRRRGSR